ncbi:MAG: DNA recombination protein RmuC [Erysipelotrichaceae bacterium]|nr:DNA recombination protein RmuC [Erysipelotrichaceae bacterium]
MDLLYIAIISILLIICIILLVSFNMLSRKIDISGERQNAASQQLNEKLLSLYTASDYSSRAVERIEAEMNSGMMNINSQTSRSFSEIFRDLESVKASQNEMSELKNSLRSLEDIFTDKKTRGTFGEIELYSILKYHYGESEERWKKQYKLDNGSIADAVIYAPQPLGLISVDAKFPLENYRRIYDDSLSEAERNQAVRKFRDDCRKHINDIHDKYVISPQTSEFAFMFVPAEAIFAEIYGHYPDVIEYSQKKSVYIVSPTTLIAYLTSMKAIYLQQRKDENVEKIQKELNSLSLEFERYQTRYGELASNLEKAIGAFRQLDVTSEKIIRDFNRIRDVEIGEKNG